MTRLKEAVTSGPVLTLPDFSQPFHIECDAFGGGVRAVLTQGKNTNSLFQQGSIGKVFKQIDLRKIVDGFSNGYSTLEAMPVGIEVHCTY